MEFVDDCISGSGKRRPLIPFPPRRVCAGRVHNHSPPAVYASPPGVGIHHLIFPVVVLNYICIIPAVKIAPHMTHPSALDVLLQRIGPACAAFPFVIELHTYPLGSGCPNPESGGCGCVDSAQV